MSSPAISAERAYEALAPFYDRLTAESDYEAWADTVEPVLRRHRDGGRRLLDLACGTGESLLPFLRRGYAVTGCDLSEAMLRQARAKAPGVRLVRADVTALPPLGRFDVVTCFDDSLNYLCSPEELETAFRSARRSLAPGGVFAFDLNTIAAYRRTFSADRVSGDRSLTFIWRGRSSPSAPAGSVAEASVDVLATRARRPLRADRDAPPPAPPPARRGGAAAGLRGPPRRGDPRRGLPWRAPSGPRRGAPPEDPVRLPARERG